MGAITWPLTPPILQTLVISQEGRAKEQKLKSYRSSFLTQGCIIFLRGGMSSQSMSIPFRAGCELQEELFSLEKRNWRSSKLIAVQVSSLCVLCLCISLCCWEACVFVMQHPPLQKEMKKVFSLCHRFLNGCSSGASVLHSSCGYGLLLCVRWDQTQTRSHRYVSMHWREVLKFFFAACWLW